MTYTTRRAAIASLREFTPAYRAAHHVVRYWSETYSAYRYARVFGRA